MKEQKEQYKCINCLAESDSLYQKYSEGVIRLTECKNCKKIVDRYIEYETVMVVVDMLLHYMEAYRHILYNMKIKNYTRLIVIFLFCDAYDKWITRKEAVGDAPIYELEWIFYIALLRSATEMGVFILMVLGLEWLMRFKQADSNKTPSRWIFLTLSTILGFYGNVAVVLSIVFRLSDQLSYRLVLHLFLFISHLQIQRSLFPSLSFAFNALYVFLASGISMISSNLLFTNQINKSIY
ncbi:hypothetical protein WR25_19814 [Diploscapter pachys]|uniref:Protein ARV n=1 Tax=Diploscapter pachys TaxID=2018661 RepID=A0A2A2LAQ2_9BILA|nr:hypothetical protein WR25_19814 [Diploscapter pachys]